MTDSTNADSRATTGAYDQPLDLAAAGTTPADSQRTTPGGVTEIERDRLWCIALVGLMNEGVIDSHIVEAVMKRFNELRSDAATPALSSLPPTEGIREAARALVLLCMQAADHGPWINEKHPDAAHIDSALWDLETVLRVTLSLPPDLGKLIEAYRNAVTQRAIYGYLAADNEAMTDYYVVKGSAAREIAAVVRALASPGEKVSHD